MSSVDTNIVLRLILRDVPEQLERIFELLDKAKPGSLAIADAVFLECVFILSGPTYHFDRQLIASLLLNVVALPQINCNRAMLETALPRYVSHSGISFIDACLATYAELNGSMPLLTFDRKLAKSLPKQVVAL